MWRDFELGKNDSCDSEESTVSPAQGYFLLLESIPYAYIKITKFSATSDVRYQVNQVRRCAAWLTNMEEKHAWIGNCKW